MSQVGGDEPYSPQVWRGVQVPENIINTWYRQELKHKNSSDLERRTSIPQPQGMETSLLLCYPVRPHLRAGICRENCNRLVLASLHIRDNDIKSQSFSWFLALFWYSTGYSMLLRDFIIFNFSFPPHQANHSIMKWWFYFLIFLFSSQCEFANQFHKPLHEEWGERLLSSFIWTFSLKEKQTNPVFWAACNSSQTLIYMGRRDHWRWHLVTGKPQPLSPSFLPSKHGWEDFIQQSLMSHSNLQENPRWLLSWQVKGKDKD